jgi:hypothetical protein
LDRNTWNHLSQNIIWQFFCRAVGDYEKAYEILTDVLSEEESLLGKEHPETLITESRLVEV